MLRVTSVSKTFTLHLLGGRRLPAVHEVSFEVEPGELVAVLGSSGSGKSSLLKCLSRTYLPSGGRAVYDSASLGPIDLVTASDAEMIALRRNEIAVVTQFLHAVPRTPADAIVAEPLLHRGLDREEARGRARELMGRLDLPVELHDAHPSTFSGGERQRVNLAKALVAAPRLLLLDEPTSALDPRTRRVASELIAETVRGGAAAVGVFHDLATVLELATRALVMEHGRVVRDGDPAEMVRYVETAAARVPA